MTQKQKTNQKRSETMKAIWAAKKAAETNAVASEPVDYKALYLKTSAENTAMQNKIAEYEKLLKSYAERERLANEKLNRATLEYNARNKYMLDCAKHAYISMQFAVAAEDSNKGGNQ